MPASFVRSALLEGGLLGVAGGGHGRLRRGMIVAQVALSLILLSSGALVVRSFERLLRADPGFRSDGVFTIRARQRQRRGACPQAVHSQTRVPLALGAKIPFGERPLTIVGVVDQARLYDVHADGRPPSATRAAWMRSSTNRSASRPPARP